jgi:hypothetical protein
MPPERRFVALQGKPNPRSRPLTKRSLTSSLGLTAKHRNIVSDGDNL